VHVCERERGGIPMKVISERRKEKRKKRKKCIKRKKSFKIRNASQRRRNKKAI